MKSPLSYFLEKLNNVQCFQLYLNIPADMPSPVPVPKVQVINSSVHCTWGEYPQKLNIDIDALIWGSYEAHITLDCDANGDKSEYQVMEDCVEIKIPFHKEKKYIDDSFQKLITPKDIL